MTKTFLLNYDNIPTEFYGINVSSFWKLPFLILVNMLSSFFKSVNREISVASNAVPINIFKGDYSNLKHWNKRHKEEW